MARFRVLSSQFARSFSSGKQPLSIPSGANRFSAVLEAALPVLSVPHLTKWRGKCDPISHPGLLKFCWPRQDSEDRKEGAGPPEFCLSGSDCLITRQSGCWFLSWSQPSRRCRYFYPRDASEIWRDKKSSGNEKYESVEFHESRNVICPLTKGALWHIFPILIISTNSPKHPCPVRHDHSLFILSLPWNWCMMNRYLFICLPWRGPGWVFIPVPMTNDVIYPNVGLGSRDHLRQHQE